MFSRLLTSFSVVWKWRSIFDVMKLFPKFSFYNDLGYKELCVSMYFLFKVVSLLPLCVLQWIASCIALLLNSYNSSMKRITEINLQLAYPHLTVQQHQALTKSSLKSQCMTYIESIKCWGMSPEYNLALLKNIYGEQYFTEALANKKGVIVVIAHFGCWELLNAWLNQYASPDDYV